MTRWKTAELAARGGAAALALLLVATGAARAEPPPANDPATPYSAATGVKDPATGIRVPKGFRATVFADALGRTRHIVARADGTVYASLARRVEGGGIVGLKDTDRTGRPLRDHRHRLSGPGPARHQADGLR